MGWLLGALGGAGSVAMTIWLIRVLFAARRVATTTPGDDEVEYHPFSEAEYVANKAGSRDWGLQQALRRAATLAKQGKAAEAVAILMSVRGPVRAPGARAVLDAEIRRLGGTPPVDSPAPAKTPEPAHDPYADRLE